MLIGVIADDFTGASDIANTLAKGTAPHGGLRTAQFSGVPDIPAPAEIDAGVVSLKSRTAPVDEAVCESLAALKWLQDQGCRQFIFKYCSTFDSTPDGNIGPVATALADHLDAAKVVFCPAFPATGRTVYQGHLFVHDKLLNQSGMENHPLTPMTDPNIRRWLSYQTEERVGHLPFSQVTQGAAVVQSALADTAERFVVADALSDADLMSLGEALADAPLITGGSGIAMGLPANLIRSGAARSRKTVSTTFEGPEAVLAGSCSGATRAQLDVHAANHPVLAIDVPNVMAGETTPEELVAFFEANTGSAPLVYSSGTPEEVCEIQQRFGKDKVAARLDAFFAETTRALIRQGYKRIVVAGGETSGAVAQAVTCEMSATAMEIGPEIDPGVPVLTVRGQNTTIGLALKSGNFGAPDFFAKALSVMAEGAS